MFGFEDCQVEIGVVQYVGIEGQIYCVVECFEFVFRIGGQCFVVYDVCVDVFVMLKFFEVVMGLYLVLFDFGWCFVEIIGVELIGEYVVVVVQNVEEVCLRLVIEVFVVVVVVFYVLLCFIFVVYFGDCVEFDEMELVVEGVEVVFFFGELLNQLCKVGFFEVVVCCVDGEGFELGGWSGILDVF